MHVKTWIIALSAVCGLSACGDTIAEQSLIGAGAGSATAIVLDGKPFTGAVIGAAGNLLYCQSNPSKCN